MCIRDRNKPNHYHFLILGLELEFRQFHQIRYQFLPLHILNPKDAIVGLWMYLENREAQMGLRTVSYTHLDVYKRQILRISFP